MDDDPVAEENMRLRDQLRTDAAALEKIRSEFDEYRREREELHRELDECRREREELHRELDGLRRQREDERQQAEMRLHEVLQRAEAAEKRAADLGAEIGAGILGRLRGLCEAVRTTVQAHLPGAGGH